MKRERQVNKTMANWDKKYFVTELNDVVHGAPWSPVFKEGEETQRVLSLDGEVIEGAFYMETAWFLPGDWPKFKSEEGTLKPHTHEYDEAIAYLGTSKEDPHDLGGEIELWIDGKRNIIDKSFVAFLPAGVEHGPLTITKIDKPILHFDVGMGKKYL
jgi:hypothetical protein